MSFLTFVVGAGEGFLIFVLVPKIHVVFFFSPKGPAGFLTKFIFMLFEDPASFLTCVLVSKTHFFVRAQWIS